MLSGLHHLELCVSNGIGTVKNLVSKYGFVTKWIRETDSCKQWVIGLSEGQPSARFVITEKKKNSADVKEEWTNFCCSNSLPHYHDSVFNVALEVKDVDKCTNRIGQYGGKIITKPRTVEDQHGMIRYSLVSSLCGNVMHTLIDRSKYSSFHFLPHFKSFSDKFELHNPSNSKTFLTGIDHVTLICRRGETDGIIDWYSKVFGMKRFFVNDEETLKDGFTIKGNVNLRLKVMEYWLCAEKGLFHEDSNGNSLKIVVGESLEGSGNNHVENFLTQHGGPGVQHVGITSTDISKSVKALRNKGVQFRTPPNIYYSLPYKLKEINSCGMNLEEIRENGILVEEETGDIDENNKKFLFQIFAYPLFKEETFFMEVIQRKGASGFGGGNIVALAHSIELGMNGS